MKRKIISILVLSVAVTSFTVMNCDKAKARGQNMRGSEQGQQGFNQGQQNRQNRGQQGFNRAQQGDRGQGFNRGPQGGGMQGPPQGSNRGQQSNRGQGFNRGPQGGGMQGPPQGSNRGQQDNRGQEFNRGPQGGQEQQGNSGYGGQGQNNQQGQHGNQRPSPEMLKNLEKAGIPSDVIKQGREAVESYAETNGITLPESANGGQGHSEFGQDQNNQQGQHGAQKPSPQMLKNLEEAGIPSDVIKQGREAVESYAETNGITLPEPTNNGQYRPGFGQGQHNGHGYGHNGFGQQENDN